MNRAAPLIIIAVAMVPLLSFSQYSEDFSNSVTLTTYVMQRFDGTEDDVWGLDTYEHEGPFSYSQKENALKITSEGHWEWDHTVIVLPKAVSTNPGGKLTMNMRVAEGSTDSKAWVTVNLGTDHEKQLLQNVPRFMVGKTYSDVVSEYKLGSADITHLFININSGYVSGPNNGWFTEPTQAFNGTVEINSITLDPGISAIPGAFSEPNSAKASLSGNILQYRLENPANIKVKVYDLSGEAVQQITRNQDAGHYSINFTSLELPCGLYWFELKANGAGILKKKVYVL